MRYSYSRSAYSYINRGVRVFSYVVAINYNHVPGTAPTSNRLTMPYYKGNKIWLHVGTGIAGTSAGCVGTSQAGMSNIVRWLNPAHHPVIIMGPHSTVTHR